MNYVINTSEYIDEHSLCAFYAQAILPQFGIKSPEITWSGGKSWIPGDEAMYCFEAEGKQYALFFFDHFGFEDRDSFEAFIRKEVLADEKQTFEFVYPKTRKPSDPNPTYDGFDIARDGHALFCPYITGTFALLRLTQTNADRP